MKTFKYITKISKTGEIKIPVNLLLSNQEVEIIIVSKTEKKITKQNANAFIKKWAGFLNNNDFNNLKFENLSEKYK